MARASRSLRRLLAPLALLVFLAPLLATLRFALPATAADLAQANALIPVLGANTGSTVVEGGGVTITNQQLRLDDGDTPPSGLVYTLTRLPAHGTLSLAGTRLPPGANFTQADIDAGRLRYTHDGSETRSDSFAFTAADGPRPLVQRVSVSSAGVEGNGRSDRPILSADGRFVTFYSRASNLVPNDTNNASDAFVYDQSTGQTRRVSVSTTGVQGNGNSYVPALSADGRFVAFESFSSNLVFPSTNRMSHIFLHDQVISQTVLVSVSNTRVQGNSNSYVPALSADGRFVGFFSLANNLVPNDTNNSTDVFVYDQFTGQTIRVSLNSTGVEGNFASYYPALSADGRFVAFQSAANNLVFSDSNNANDIFVYDRVSSQTSRVSVNSSGLEGNGESYDPEVSADGQLVTFYSAASNLVSNDTNNAFDSFVYNRVSGQTSRVSVSSSGAQANGGSGVPVLSANGRFVTFHSIASNLVGNDTNNVEDSFVYDRIMEQTTKVSTSNTGILGNGASLGPVPSADGRIVAFESDATNLVPNDTNNVRDIFVYHQGVSAEVGITITPVNDPPNLEPIGDLTLIRNRSSQPILLAIGDDVTPADQLQVSASSSNPGVVANSGLLIGGAGAARSLVVEPRPDQTGQSTITVSVGDGQATTTRSFTVTVTPPPPEPPPAWLALLYFAGDDIPPSQPGVSGLTEPLEDALSRLGTMAYNPDVRIVALFDGDQPGDSKLLVREQEGWVAPATPPSWLSPELDTGSVATLRNFITWGRQRFPGAEHTFLSVVDHGGGWAPDEGSVGQPRGRQMAAAGGWTGLSLDVSTNEGIGTSLSTRETGEALAGLEPIDVLFFDACLMGLLESAYEVQPSVDFLVAGQSILWSQLPYERYLSSQRLTKQTTPETFARQLIADYNLGAPADEPYTIAAWKLSGLSGTDGLVAAVENMSAALLTAYANDSVTTYRAVRAAYEAAQKFDYDSSYTQDPTDGYIDLADFAAWLALNGPPEIRNAAQQVVDRVSATILNRKSVEGTPRGGSAPWLFAGARGVAIYAPLGERDCRPSGRPIDDVAQAAVAPCAAPAEAKIGDLQVEPQLPYYADSAQLRLSRDAPSLARLLTTLDPSTPNRSSDKPGPQTPYQGPARFSVYLPLAAR